MPFQARPSVLWREGMFLCPQHLQAHAREVQDRIHASMSIGSPGDWGIVSLEIDEEALRRDTLHVVSGDVVLADGTLASFPTNATVAQRDFAEFFVDTTLDVFLGIPALRPGVSGLTETGDDDGARYRAHPGVVHDENLAAAERDIDFKLLQARVFFGDEDRTGYESLRIARLVRRGRPEAYSALSETFIPTVLSCKGSPVLVRELNEVADQLAAQARDLASRIPQTAYLGSDDKGANVAAFVKLQAVNQAVPGVDLARRLLDLHPFHAYTKLVDAVGSLAIFGESRTVPDLLPYAHEDLDGCFRRALEVVRDLIPRQVEVPYDSEAFQADTKRPGLLECSIPANWLRGDALFFLGVRPDCTPEKALDLDRSAFKLTAEEDLDDVLVAVTGKIELEHVRTPPLAFPKDDLLYYRVSSEGPSRDAWLRIAESERALLVLSDPTTKNWEFGLYVELGD
ncbi:MAG: type VI secretion system baseplate subunit TssK [Planctomycetota bacterium]